MNTPELQAKRRQLTLQVVVNILFMIPYIIFAVMGRESAPTWVIFPMMLWGFIGFRWLMNAFFRLTNLTIFMSATNGCFTYIVGSMVCSGLGIFVIPILIVSDIMELAKLQDQ